jgi:hypothetical protein
VGREITAFVHSWHLAHHPIQRLEATPETLAHYGAGKRRRSSGLGKELWISECRVVGGLNIADGSKFLGRVRALGAFTLVYGTSFLADACCVESIDGEGLTRPLAMAESGFALSALMSSASLRGC